MFASVKVRNGKAAVATVSALLVAASAALSSPVASAASPNTCGSSFALSPTPTGHEVTGMTSFSDGEAWAVGLVGNNKTLVEHWNGSQWAVQTSPNPSVYSDLWGVAGSSTTDIWAVGNQSHYGPASPLVEHWDGVTWSVMSAPKFATGQTALLRVSASSPGDAYAVGLGYLSGAPGGGYETLIEHWDGTQWSMVPTPSGATTGVLESVVDLGGSDVWAVGSQTAGTAGGSYTQSPLFLHYDGTSWSVVGVSAVGYPTSVSASSATDVWAVGPGSAEHWDGTTWTSVPLASGVANDVDAVTAVSPTDAFIAGYDNISGDPLVEHWDGTHWSVVPSQPFTGWQEFLAITAQPHFVMAGGFYTKTTTNYTRALIEEACG